MPSRYEVEYSEAILAYNEKAYAKAISILDALLKILPPPVTSEGSIPQDNGKVDFLELRVLCSKALNDEAKTLETYGNLIKAKIELKRPRKELAPYYFEIGVIHFKHQRDDKAAENLEESLRQGFNADASAFFLGNIAFRHSEWDKASRHFKQVSESKFEDLRPASFFYLGKIGQKQVDSAEAFDSFTKARELAEAQIADPNSDRGVKQSAEEIKKAADAALAPYTRPSVFGNVAVMTGYDTNVLSVPNTQSGSSDTTGKDSVTTALSGSVGYMTSPSDFVQFVPSYRTSLSYNLNQDTRAGDFFVHTGSLYINRLPLARTGYGIHFDFGGTWQNQLDPETNRSKFQPYSVSGVIGPYFRTRLAPKLTLNTELSISPHRDYGDKGLATDLKRSGTDVLLKGTLKKETDKPLFNPGGSLSYDSNDTEGSEYRSHTLGLEVNNLFKVSDRWDVLASLGLSFVNYSSRSAGSRKDTLLLFAGSATYKWKPKWNVLVGAQYYHNSSNFDETYGYSRLAFSGGVGFNF